MIVENERLGKTRGYHSRAGCRLPVIPRHPGKGRRTIRCIRFTTASWFSSPLMDIYHYGTIPVKHSSSITLLSGIDFKKYCITICLLSYQSDNLQTPYRVIPFALTFTELIHLLFVQFISYTLISIFSLAHGHPFLHARRHGK